MLKELQFMPVLSEKGFELCWIWGFKRNIMTGSSFRCDGFYTQMHIFCTITPVTCPAVELTGYYGDNSSIRIGDNFDN